MKLHIKKILLKYYKELLQGNKNFELRKDDSGYNVGDLIKFLVPLDVRGAYCDADEGDKMLIYSWDTPYKDGIWEITYILRDAPPEYGLQKGYCILALKRVQIKDYVEEWKPNKIMLTETAVSSFEALNK